MSAFISVAVLLAVAAAVFAAAPLLRTGNRTAPPERLLGTVTALVLIAGGFALYLAVGHGSWRSPAPSSASAATDGAGSETISSLLQATQQHPNDVQGWLRLGSGYLRSNQWALARRSFRRADSIAAGRSAEALVGLAQSIDVENDGNETDSALALYERAVQLDPQSLPALFYSALAQMRAGKLQLARDRFAAMLALQPPTAVSAALSKQIASLDASITDESRRAQANAATALHLSIELAPTLQGQVKAGASLFVFVRSPQGGPPLAAKRLPATFPQQLELSAADSMIAGNSFAAGQKVLVVARISTTGTPTARPGDLYGQLETIAGHSKVLRLVIDKTN